MSETEELVFRSGDYRTFGRRYGDGKVWLELDGRQAEMMVSRLVEQFPNNSGIRRTETDD